MATSNPFEKQIQNRNFLSPIGFKFTLVKCPKVSFFANTAQIPGLNIQPAEQPTYLKDIPRPGDKMDFQDFTLRFLVDENLENYMQIQNWMRGIAFPDNLTEIYRLWSGKADFADSDPKNPDFFFVPLIYLESFSSPSAVLEIMPGNTSRDEGGKIQMPLDWHILLGDPECGDLEILPLCI